MYRKGAILKNERIPCKLFNGSNEKAMNVISIPTNIGEYAYAARSRVMDDIEAYYVDPPTCSGSTKWRHPFIIFCSLILLSATFADLQYWSREHNKNDLAKREEMLKLEIQSSRAYAKKLEIETERLRNQMLLSKDQNQKFQKQIYDFRKEKENMRESVQKYSKHLLLSQFGPGPHYVEIQLEFDPNSNAAALNSQYHDNYIPYMTADRIVVEMAPIEEMPHTVLWFLQQVSLGLYDGFSFHLNARHVIQAGGVQNFRTTPKTTSHKLYERFTKAGLETILFQEYSENYPHLPFTLGFAGRPGGPDFYINLLNNNIVHGPRDAKNVPRDADPCFAKVVEGFSAVNRIHRSAVQPSPNSERMTHNVIIKKMTIVQRRK